MTKQKRITGEYYDYDYWNSQGGKSPKHGYDSIESLEGLAREIADDFIKVYAVPQGAKLLDLGCGGGYMVARWVEKGIDATGVDFSQYAIEKGLQLWPQLKGRLRIAPATDLPADDGNMDIVYCNQVFEHIYDAEALAAAQEAFRVLRPGGLLWTGIVLANAWMDEKIGDPRFDESHVNVQPREYWDDIFREAGFRLYPNAEWRFAAESVIYKRLKWQLACYLKPPTVPSIDLAGMADGLFCLPVGENK
jgi:ubiquinone/menaquinone biosynthesis C-methylase UbiE